MKTLTFNVNSWHFLLATKVANYRVPSVSKYSDGEFYTYGDSADICTYSKHVMGGALLLTIAAALIGLVGFLLAHVLIGVWFSFILGTWFFSSWAEATMIITLVVVASFVMAFLFKWYIERKRSTEYRNRPDGFVKHAYRSWKEKFCVKINFVEAGGNT